MIDLASSRFPFVAGVFVAGLRLLAALLFIGVAASTSDFEPVMFPVQLDRPSVFVARTLYNSTGWPERYRGPADPAFLGISLVTWFIIGVPVGVVMMLRQRAWIRRCVNGRVV